MIALNRRCKYVAPFIYEDFWDISLIFLNKHRSCGKPNLRWGGV